LCDDSGTYNFLLTLHIHDFPSKTDRNRLIPFSFIGFVASPLGLARFLPISFSFPRHSVSFGTDSQFFLAFVSLLGILHRHSSCPIMSSFLPQPSAIMSNTTPSLSSSSPYPHARFSRPLLMPILRTDCTTTRFFGRWCQLSETRLLD
jgi:hypothetical protein